MSIEHDQAPQSGVNAEVPVNDPDVPSMGVEDRPTVAPPLLDPNDLDRLRAQWRELQGAFVDSPQEAVTRADALVTETLQQITTTFAQRKQQLVDQWSPGQDGDTEDLRQALRGYRDYFDRLLTI
ncbi:hypothetical protein [Nocardia heshunensis]